MGRIVARNGLNIFHVGIALRKVAGFCQRRGFYGGSGNRERGTICVLIAMC
jgi:hypothetical protein